MTTNNDIIIFDVETTGKDVSKDQIVEFSVLCGFHEKAKEYTWRVKPLIRITPGAQEIHGISMEDVENEPTFKQLGNKIYKLLSKASIWVGYNLDFDIHIIQEEFRRNGFPRIDMSEKIILDPYKLWMQREQRKLANAYKRFVGKDLEGAHAANVDTRATAEVFIAMLKEYELVDTSWEEVSKMCDPERTKWIGSSKHFQWNEDGEPIIAVGKHSGKTLAQVKRESSGYFNWIVNQDFPSHVKEIADRVSACRSSKELKDWIIENFGGPPEEEETQGE